MVFVEGLRLLVVLAGVLIGEVLGADAHPTVDGRFVGATIGALAGYVAGGVAGRLLHRGFREATRSLGDIPAIELLAGALLGSLAALLGVVICVPLFVFVRSVIDFPLAAAVAWTAGTLGLRLGMAKGGQLAEALGLTRRLSGRPGPAPAGGLLLDTSAVMERALLSLARFGLLPHDIYVPEFVIDHVRTIASGPDPIAGRRARRGLEALDAIRLVGNTVSIVAGEVPVADETDSKMAVLAAEMGLRLATCSASLASSWEADGLAVLDLRRLSAELAPDHVPGELLRVDLVRAGRQPRQAIGYLPEGDMVVVNDAEELIGTTQVEVEVLSTRQTSQGLLVFARRADDPDREPSLHG